jgi:hypothetical protein
MRRASPLVRFPIMMLAAWTVVAICAAPGRAGPAALEPFLSHQAVYDLALQKARGNATVNHARGRILYNFAGNACEGYTTDFRQVSELDSGENKTTVSDLRSTSWEDADGKNYRFKIETRMNDNGRSAIDGAAERSGNTITVKLKLPKAKTFTLDPGTVFPTDQVRRIIAAAKAGKSVLELIVYDGSDDGEHVYNTLTVIGQPIPGDRTPARPDAATGSDAMKGLTRWPVTVSYYDRAARADSGEQTPAYAMSFELYENGVSRSLVLDYNEFVLSGTMSKLEAKDTKPCKP